MMTIKRTDSQDDDFIELVKLLDTDLKIRDGEDHAFYNQFNGIVNIKNCVVCYESSIPVACGAIKPFDGHTMEVKRMFVMQEYRGNGFAINILSELESWAKELGYSKCILETGMNQPEAISLYKKGGYHIIANYGQYAGVVKSVCFEKQLIGNV